MQRDQSVPVGHVLHDQAVRAPKLGQIARVNHQVAVAKHAAAFSQDEIVVALRERDLARCQ